MGHRAQERAYRPKERSGSHPPPQHRLYAGAAMNERYKEHPKGASRRTHDMDEAAERRSICSFAAGSDSRDAVAVTPGVSIRAAPPRWRVRDVVLLLPKIVLTGLLI